MRKSGKSPCITFDGMTWGERELSRLIRRRMLTKEVRNKKKYTRKIKHNGSTGFGDL